MEDDELHLSRIQTAWSMVRRAHGDHTAVHAAQQSFRDREANAGEHGENAGGATTGSSSTTPRNTPVRR